MSHHLSYSIICSIVVDVSIEQYTSESIEYYNIYHIWDQALIF